MPTIFYSTDGRRPHTQSGPGIDATHDEVAAAFAGYELKFVGLQPPSINPDRPTTHLTNVVVEIGSDEAGTRGLQPGFYLAVGARPDEIGTRLQRLREQNKGTDDAT